MDGGSVRCAGSSLGQHRHICAFFNGFDEQHRVLGSFIKEGFERGDKAFHIIDPELWEDHLKRLAETGIDVEQAIGTGPDPCLAWNEAVASRTAILAWGRSPCPTCTPPSFSRLSGTCGIGITWSVSSRGVSL